MAEEVSSALSRTTCRELNRLNTKTKIWKVWYDGNDSETQDDRDECGNYLLEMADRESDDDPFGEDEPDGDTAFCFELHGMVNCCGIVVLTEVNAAAHHSLDVLRIAADIARAAGYGMIVTTHRTASDVGYACTKARGWVKLAGFTNPRTNNRLGMWGKKL